jgi:hypothetical protein
MLSRTVIEDKGTHIHVSVRGPMLYLDNWALIDLAERLPTLRTRFLNVIHSGVDLLFSVTNAAELSGPRGRSLEIIREFLDEIGPHWFPARMDAVDVMRAELSGRPRGEACFAQDFFTTYMARQTRAQREHGHDEPDRESLFRLGAILDWVPLERDSIRDTSAKFDQEIKSRVADLHRRTRKPGAALLPLTFNPSLPATFVFNGLIRLLGDQPHVVKKGDGMDLCHAVIATAYASFAALDSRWKHRIDALPPNRLARVYGPKQLGLMVADIEDWIGKTNLG